MLAGTWSYQQYEMSPTTQLLSLHDTLHVTNHAPEKRITSTAKTLSWDHYNNSLDCYYVLINLHPTNKTI